MRRAGLLVLCASTAAGASPWQVTAEGGAEYDTNVQRVETGPQLDTRPISAGVIRLGGKLARRDRLAGGTYSVAASMLARVVGGDSPEEDVSPENVVLATADLRWLHPLGERPVAAGFALTGADAIPLTDAVGARTFANAGADGLVSIHDDDDRVLTLAAGGRAFTYKPDPEFDWNGATVNARLDLPLWQNADKTRSLELAAFFGFDVRAYRGNAFADACARGASPSPSCFAPTTIARIDRYHRAGVEATYTGRVVASLGYQLIVIDSNSYGQSLVRHRVQASATTGLPAGLYGTLLAIVQLDTYLDGLVVETDPNHQTFTSLDDENRSSIQLRLGRPLTDAWSVEARAAVWRNLGQDGDNSFARELVYAGVIYSK